MSKTRARERAKDNAFKKLKKKLAAKAAGPDEETNSGKFDANSNSIKSPRANPNANNFAGATRGSARSK